MEGRVWVALHYVDPVDPGACVKLVFRLRETLLLRLETPWGVSPARMATRTPQFWARTGLEPGASGLRRPRVRPLGNLTTVGHLAKVLVVSPDLTLHFHRFLTQRKARFLTHDGALGVKMGGNESYGRPTSFYMGLPPAKKPPKNQKMGVRSIFLGGY